MARLNKFFGKVERHFYFFTRFAVGFAVNRPEQELSIMQNPQNFRNTSSLLDRLELHVGHDNMNGISKPVRRGMTGCAAKDTSIFLVLYDAQSKSAQNADPTRTVK
jgi:hypothetical protein